MNAGKLVALSFGFALAGSAVAAVPSGWEAGADVTVDSAVVLDESTPALNSLTVASGGTLTFTNWTTKLSATTVTVQNGGLVTCAGPYAPTAMSNRVWIACRDLVVAAGAAIDVNSKGFAQSTDVSNWTGSGLGPGAGQARNRGAWHGGSIADTTTPTGVLAQPIQPGASGGNEGPYLGGKGGGVITIEATGDVVVNGTVSANGANVGNNGASCGAGGSIWIASARFLSAGGIVSAKGGDKSGGTYGSVLCGGGGRIAIDYDVEAQKTAEISSVTITAAAGRWLKSNGSGLNYTQASVLKVDPGTIWFPDAQIFTAVRGEGLVGKLAFPATTSLTIEGDWAVSNAVRFVNEGMKLHVTGDLVVDGPEARLGMGGGNVYAPQVDKQTFKFVGHFSGSQAWTLSAGGDLVITNGAKVECFPAAQPMTDETTAFGGLVAVTGTVSVATNCVLELRSDMVNGASVRVCASAADIQAGALVTAVDFGWATAYGPGYKSNYSAGGSYGGVGGYSTDTYLYGTRQRPYQPGSGGGVESYRDLAFRGAGGVVHFRISGLLQVDGTIDASASQSAGIYTSQSLGSGGGILLDCGSFAGSGALLATGGFWNWNRRSQVHSAGGGGRISVCVGEQLWTPTMGYAALKEVASIPEFTGTTNVAGGTVVYYGDSKVAASATQQGTAGTVGFFSVEPFDADVVWTGNAGDGRWDSAENWSGHAVPAAGEKVAMIGQAGNDAVCLDASTASLASLLLDGMTMTVTNWNTAIRAQKLTIAANAVVTVANGTTNDIVKVTETIEGEERTWYEGASRVLIECGDLALMKDARIDVKGKGFRFFRTSNTAWAQAQGTGPGKGKGRQSGAAYGGDNMILKGYGSAEKPEDLGSSGGGLHGSYWGMNGGGAVKIVATGTVTLDGEIDASGQDMGIGSGNAGTSAGSGGSIYIACNRIAGRNGRLNVRGGRATSVASSWSPNWGGMMQATGGRIAVDYTSLGEVSGLTFDADFSEVRDGNVTVSQVNTADKNIAEPGTIWFPDDALFTAQNGAGFIGQLIIPDCTALDVAGDWAISRPLWFAMTNLTVTVGGNLTVDGGSASLALATMHDYRDAWPFRSSGRESPCALSVGGDVALTNGAKLVVYPTYRASRASAAEAVGGTVSIEGDLAIAANSFVETPTDPVNGSFVKYTVGGNLWIAANGKVTGDELGVGSSSVGSSSSGKVSREYGAVGGGHGGLGGGWVTNAQGVVTQGGTYGDAKRPYLPGVSGRYRWANSPNIERSRGGGVVFLTVAGTAVVDGSITAKGRSTTGTVSSGGSGGAVVLDCLALSGSGVISANGGSTVNNDSSFNGVENGYTKLSPGGGGRVAIYEGKYTYGTPRVTRIAKASLGADWTGTVEAKAGTFTTSKPTEVLERNKPTDGTIAFFDAELQGLMLFVR